MKREQQLSIGLDSDNERTQIITEDGQHLAYIEQDPHEEFASQIIRRFNSHASLVEALRDCVTSLEKLPDVDGAYRVTCISQGGAALRAAEAGSGSDEKSRTDSCEDCGSPTSFERTDPSTQPPEGEVCEQCQRWVCPECVHPIGETCPERKVEAVQA